MEHNNTDTFESLSEGRQLRNIVSNNRTELSPVYQTADGEIPFKISLSFHYYYVCTPPPRRDENSP